MNEFELTAVFLEDGKWWVAWIEELPGVNTQGRSLGEAEENLNSALKEFLEMNRSAAPEVRSDMTVMRRTLFLKAS